MENRFFFGLLMLGEANLAIDYFLFCLIGSLGTLQFVAGRYNRHDLTFLPPRIAQLAGLFLIGFAFVWFFTMRPDIFIPGLAGGEFLAYAVAAFVCAYVVVRVVMFMIAMVERSLRPASGSERQGNTRNQSN